MPISANALAKSGTPPIPPMPPHGSAPQPQGPPLMPLPPMQPPQITQAGGMAPSAQPQLPPAPEPQPNFVPQSDGTIAVTFQGPDGNPLVSQVFPKPKTPKALQQPQAPQ